MRIDVSSDGQTLLVRECFENLVFETSEGNRFAICMRDDTVEMTVTGSGKWFRANMQTGEIDAL